MQAIRWLREGKQGRGDATTSGEREKGREVDNGRRPTWLLIVSVALIGPSFVNARRPSSIR